jgi:hypothetical protein
VVVHRYVPKMTTKPNVFAKLLNGNWTSLMDCRATKCTFATKGRKLDVKTFVKKMETINISANVHQKRNSNWHLITTNAWKYIPVRNPTTSVAQITVSRLEKMLNVHVKRDSSNSTVTTKLAKSFIHVTDRIEEVVSTNVYLKVKEECASVMKTISSILIKNRVISSIHATEWTSRDTNWKPVVNRFATKTGTPSSAHAHLKKITIWMPIRELVTSSIHVTRRTDSDVHTIVLRKETKLCVNVILDLFWKKTTNDVKRFTLASIL